MSQKCQDRKSRLIVDIETPVLIPLASGTANQVIGNLGACPSITVAVLL